LSIVRKLLYVVGLVLLVCVAGVFAYNNPDPIAIDLGVVRFENVSLALVVACAFGIGWLFGLAAAGVALFRMANDRRRAQRELRMAELEVNSLRSLPMHDAN
jgi:putative membrane protein